MWYHEFGTRTEIELGASPRLLCLFGLAHGLIFLAIYLAALPAAWQCVLALINALALRSHLLCWAFPWEWLAAERVVLTPRGRFLLLGQGGEEREFQLQRVVWSWPGLVVLRLCRKAGRDRRWLVLAGDAVCPRASRRLRVRLRWGGIDRFLGPLRGLGAARPVGRQ